MIGRSDTSYYFIVEPRPEDTPESLQASLLNKPFLRSYLVDYTYEFIRDNSWLNRRKNLEINNLLLDKTFTVIKVGNPLDDYKFLNYMKTL